MSSNKFVQSVIGKKPKSVKAEPYVHVQKDCRVNLARVMMTGVFKNQVYRSQDDAINEAMKLAPQMAKDDPTYLLKTACYARDHNMKGMVKIGIAALNGHASTSFLSRESTRLTVIGLLSTFHPGQLLQFVELVKSKKFGTGFGSRPQKWVRSVMENWKSDKLETFTLKYPNALNSLLRLVHPRYTDERGKIVNYILSNKDTHGTRQKAFDKIKTGKLSSSQVAKDILDHDIPWDCIKGVGITMNDDLAMAQMVQMGLSALLLNMRSIESTGIFKAQNGIQALKLKMQEVKNARSIPIDFAKPYVHCSDQNVKNILLDAMADALDVPMPFLETKKVGVSVDISGSMNGEALQTAGLLAAPFMNANNLWFTTFDDKLYEEGDKFRAHSYYANSRIQELCPVLKGKTRAQQIKSLLDLKANGGTNIALSINKAISDNRKLDLMVIITDEQQNLGTKLMTAWKAYKTINKNAELWVVNASNYTWTACDYNDPSVTVYHTMTPTIFRNLEFCGVDLVSIIENYDLAKTRKKSN